ncbi:MAG: long-chain-acyl-CoA synthetase [Xanthobacteraceae bacterium]|nr:long-chain-acyl-CoA synthetase [Xanthobacteraceae bacterium]
MPNNQPRKPSRLAQNRWLRALELTAPIAQNPVRTFPVLIDELADKFGPAPALLSAQGGLSYAALARRCHQYARWALAHNLTRGRVLCLVMQNCPEYVAVWLGVTRVGATVALINTNLTGDLLARAINAVAPQHVVTTGELAAIVAAVRPRLAPDVELWTVGEAVPSFQCLDAQAGPLGEASLSLQDRPAPSLSDRALYIYTSGTTGLPRPAAISHFRLMQWTHWFAGMMDVEPADRLYNCLPLYHAIGGILAPLAPLLGGASVFVRPGFSASVFWDEVIAQRCTIFQYIGELCRYLLSAAPHPRERDHVLRLCCGNGLRRDIWNAFQQRFAIPHILEFYAATESPVSLYNCEESPGAIGRIPPFLAHRFPIALIPHDFNTGAPARDQHGFCIRCDANEAGEAIQQIEKDGGGASGFEGYVDPVQSEQKLLRDAFRPGDVWFRTGDLLRRDQAGHFYFVDRIGDTFRWKGENVSTSEVADVIRACPGIQDAAVYGVVVPGAEGRAGMAAIVADRDFDIADLLQHMVKQLPSYARPLFIRFLPRIDTTATFRPKTIELAREGYDPSQVPDPIYFNDVSQRSFVRLDAGLYDRLCAGEQRI